MKGYSSHSQNISTVLGGCDTGGSQNYELGGCDSHS